MPDKNTILIAEDDEDDRFLIKYAFTKTAPALTVAFVCNGEEAIAYLLSRDRAAGAAEKQPPILLLLDIKMPRINGFEVLEWLVNHPAHRPAMVVIFSSSADPKDLKRARELNCDGYFVKPCDSAEYLQIATELQCLATLDFDCI
jgi:CheY-like chemotaxis protein